MPVPIVCLDARLHQFALTFRDCFSRPQMRYFVIERPYLRNQRSITNLNTLLYVLINLRALGRVRAHFQTLAQAAAPSVR